MPISISSSQALSFKNRTKSVVGLITGFWAQQALLQLRRSTKCLIHLLPLDIIVDEIFIYLLLEDIFALRQVDKYFFLLTHEPVIWKRFLVYTNAPIPPIRPTFNYASQVTDFEVEQLVSRAISLEDNWRRRTPLIRNSLRFKVHLDILDMKLLPGGKYLVASARSDMRFSVVLYVLDHPDGPRALARFRTVMKAYDLQARYMHFEGLPVIMVSYIRRSRFAEDDHKAMPDLNEYASGAQYDIDDSNRIMTELVVVRINLETVDAIANPHLHTGDPETSLIALKNSSGPFHEVLNYRISSSRLHPQHVSLFEMDAKPYVAMVCGINWIRIQEMEGHRVIEIICDNSPKHAGKYAIIRAIRPLPRQREILVFRTVETAPKEFTHVIERFEIVMAATRNKIQPKESSAIAINGNISRVHISDYIQPVADDFDLPSKYHPPPPISIYLEMMHPCGVIHYVVWPSIQKIRGIRTWMYTCEWVCVQTRHESEPYITRILPGAFRAFAYTHHKEDRRAEPRVFHFRRYINPEFRTNDYPTPRVERMSPIMRRGLRPMAKNAYATVYVSTDALEHYVDHGLAAIAWDESIGRVCLSSGKDQSIEIADYADVTHPDARFEQWKMAQGFVKQM